MDISKIKLKPAFEDERGSIFDLVDKEDIRHIGLITSRKGAIRGNHYHKSAKQITYVLSGKIELTLKDAINKNAKSQTIVMEANDIVTIPPMVIHSVKAVEDSRLLIFTDRQRSDNGYENDTHRV